VLLLGVALAGCGVTDFDIDQAIMEQRITGSPLPGPLALLFPIPLNIDIAAKIKEMETGPIDSVTISSLKLTITPTGVASGDTDDWAFVDEIHVFVSSNKQGTTLPRVEIAKVVNPGAVQTLDFEVDKKIDINPYVNEGSTVEARARERSRATMSPTTASPSSPCIRCKRVSQLGDDAGGRPQPHTRPVVVVRLAKHGRALVDQVNDALMRPGHVELDLLERTDEVLDQLVA
jgi:hypothetical protein